MNHKNITKRYEMSFSEIIMRSLTSLYVIGGILIILVLYRISIIFSSNGFAVNEDEWWQRSLIHFVIISIIIVTSILFTYVRLGTYTILSDRDNIYISKGIIHKTQYTIRKDHITAIVMKKTFPRRLLNIVKVELVHFEDRSGKENIKISTLFPLISESQLINVLREIVPECEQKENLDMLPKEAYFVHLTEPNYSIVVVTFFVFFFWPEYWFIPLAFFIWLVLYRISKTNNMKYFLADEQIQLQSGVFTTEMIMTEWDKISEFTLRQSWLEKKLNLATIHLALRGKPNYKCTIEHLHVEEAIEYLETYQLIKTDKNKRKQ